MDVDKVTDYIKSLNRNNNWTSPVESQKHKYKELAEVGDPDIYNMVRNTVLSLDVDEELQPNAIQLTMWPIGSKQDPHVDTVFAWRTYASIIYLNDDYIGGHTCFKDDTIIPRKGKVVSFDGSREHWVSEVEVGTRYTIAVFWTPYDEWKFY